MTDAPPAAGPVAESQREHAIDTLRGFALLGILAMNIMAFAQPAEAYANPMIDEINVYAGAFEGANKIAYWVTHIVFDLKMMSLFSILFGAGIVLMSERIAARQAQAQLPVRPWPLHYRRMAWLLVLGMLHAYLVWWGDILVSYAICGMLVYPLRRLSPRALLIAAFIVLAISVPMSFGIAEMLEWMRHKAADLQAQLDAGQTLGEDDQKMLDQLREQMASMHPTAESVQKEVEEWRGDYVTILGKLAKSSAMMQTMYFVLGTLWRAAGCMLLGMALMKLGALTAKLSPRTYATMAVTGLLTGVPLIVIGIFRQTEHKFNMDFGLREGMFYNSAGSLLMDMAYIGIIMLMLQKGAAAGLTTRLAAVGRMAFTNYLSQSLICTFIFYGWGLGYFGRLERAELMLVVAGVWILQLVWSPLWLKRFRMGPFEWVWRSLTYWRPQPLRRGPGPG